MKLSKQNQIFGKELFLLEKAKTLVDDKNLNKEAFRQEFISLCNHYEKLINEAKVITSVSDRLHSKLNQANSTLQEQAVFINNANQNLRVNNQILQDTIEQLLKAKIGRKASSIVLLIAMALFVLSEGLLEPWVESFTDSEAYGFVFKGMIALLLKPIDMLVERFLMQKAFKARKMVENTELAQPVGTAA